MGVNPWGEFLERYIGMGFEGGYMEVSLCGGILGQVLGCQQPHRSQYCPV